MLADLIESSLDDTELDDSVDMEVIDALTARERLGCTGLGHGVAIPHGRVDFIDEPIGAAITLAEPIDFDAPDNQPVDPIVGLLIPENEVNGHLKILASLAKFFDSEENRVAMRKTHSADEILKLLKNLDHPENPKDEDPESNEVGN